jgi:hypothetical protein
MVGTVDAMIRELRHHAAHRGPSLHEWRAAAAHAYHATHRQPVPLSMRDCDLAKRLGWPLRTPRHH